MKKILFDDNWKFYNGDPGPRDPAEGWGGAKAGAYDFGAAKASLDDLNWRTVNLPHDFVVEGDYTKNSGEENMRAIPEMESIDSRHFAGGCLEPGVAWYRKRFTLDASEDVGRVLIHFDGVYRDSDLYLNQYYIGTHVSGYTGFYYDITDFLNIGGENVLAIRVDATGREGWWYEGGGIYRHVWLEFTDSVRFVKDGIFVASEVNLNDKSAAVSVSAEIENKLTDAADVSVNAEIFDANGVLVKSFSHGAAIEAWDCAKVTLNSELSDITLWDIDNPYLYSAKVRLYSKDRLLDEEEISFGIRKAEFDAERGFLLNGRRVVIKGVCCHHDHAGVGIAVPDEVHRYRLARIKSMGANAFRSAHYAAPKQVLDLCDRMGILVFDETRRMSSAPEDIKCLRDTVRSGRNHPSVILWGIGNEEIFAQHKPEMKRIMASMIAEVRKQDPTRSVTSAVVCWDGVKRYDDAHMFFGITNKLDVMGFNYCKTAWDDYHRRYPNQPVIVTEESSNSWTRGCYSTDENKSQYYAYDPENEAKCRSGKKADRFNMGEDAWKYVAERDYLAGLFIWTGIDYRGEPTPLAYPSVYTQFGVMDYCAFPKDNFYYYRSWWQTEPVLHLFPHWNYPDKRGVKLPVYCYSNLDEVELFVNGKSYGRKEMDKNWYLNWDNVIYEPGELKAIGYKKGVAALTETVRTTGAPAAVKAEVYGDNAETDKVIIINIDITDSDGRTVPTADNLLSFEVCGGEFIGAGNGNPGDHDSDKLPVRRAFNGKCQLLVRRTGRVSVKITSPGISGCVVEL